ncbi:transcriptional regulator [Candidatus Saccharibacteria bacterium]|nr:transcriptional regulator [Candidatus Saccharibacteria bacterium]
MNQHHDRSTMTDRQRAILFALVEQYAEVAAPVGSVMLAKLFDVSSATIRAEMSALEDLGLVTTPHTSAGRIPTDAGYRAYVNESANQPAPHKFNRLTNALETRVVTHSQVKPDQAIRSAVDSLVELTGNLGLATIGGQLYIAGMSNLFSQPEFRDGSAVQGVARLLDNLEPWLREARPDHPVNVFIGAENPIGQSSQASLIVARFRSPYSDKSYIGVLGPTRQNYVRAMTLVGAAGQMLENNFYKEAKLLERTNQ